MKQGMGLWGERPGRVVLAVVLAVVLGCDGPKGASEDAGQDSAVRDDAGDDAHDGAQDNDIDDDGPDLQPDAGEDAHDAGDDADPGDAHDDLRDDPDLPDDAGDVGQDPSEDARDDADAAPDGSTWGPWEALGEQVTVQTELQPDGLRRYRLVTSAVLRGFDDVGGAVYAQETQDAPRVRSGNPLFDAVFALALDEARQNKVEELRDGAFNDGAPVACDCFETGALWPYAWTRDSAYAADLGLAWLDPSRTRRTLEFKLSAPKSGDGDEVVVQDTGTGGSWPVSSDRVVWSLGAWETLKFLDGPEREAFRRRALDTLLHTLEQDRAVVWDSARGGWRGETSFLDWREQTYASTTAQDTTPIAGSQAFSTNLLYADALWKVLQHLPAQDPRADELGAWYADTLLALSHFWDEEAALPASVLGPGLDPGPVGRHDLLSLSLSAVQGLVRDDVTRQWVARYPRGPLASPVIWPQQPFTPIYHNRSSWPFVSAYSALAARRVGNARVFDHELNSMLTGAAVHLSHMENFEWWTLRDEVQDGPYTGPVVNSRRQLWSVAGYLGLVVRGVFGMQANDDLIAFRPFVTPALRDGWLADTDRLVLEDFPYRGKRLDIVVELPPRGQTGGAFTVARLALDGQEHPTSTGFGPADLQDHSTLTVTLAPNPDGDPGGLNLLASDDDFRALYAPREPTLAPLTRTQEGLRLEFDANGEQGVVFHVWRDGALIASDLAQGAWTDPAPDLERQSPCYAVEAAFPSSVHRSHRSAPQCWWGAQGQRVQEWSAYAARPIPGAWSTEHGRPHYRDWGGPDEVWTVEVLRPRWTGRHQLQLLYGNGAGPINTGITAAVKRVTLTDLTTGQPVASQVVAMPQVGAWDRWRESTLAELELIADRPYRLDVTDAPNMSYLEHFRGYTGGAGGGEAPFNRVNLSGVRLLPREGSPSDRDTGALVALGTSNDPVLAFDEAQRLTPGITTGPRDVFAMTWDEDYLYLSVTAEAMDTNYYKTFQVYLEAGDALSDPTPARGQTYGEQTPTLPFTPTHLITLRSASEGDASFGPWNGAWRRDQDQWRQLVRFTPGSEWWSSPSGFTLSARVDRAWLGSPSRVRLAAHLVNLSPGEDWKDTLPPTHAPWTQDGGDFYELDLAGPALPAAQWPTR